MFISVEEMDAPLIEMPFLYPLEPRQASTLRTRGILLFLFLRGKEVYLPGSCQGSDPHTKTCLY